MKKEEINLESLKAWKSDPFTKLLQELVNREITLLKEQVMAEGFLIQPDVAVKAALLEGERQGLQKLQGIINYVEDTLLEEQEDERND